MNSSLEQKRGRISDSPKTAESDFLVKLLGEIAQRLKSEYGYVNEQLVRVYGEEGLTEVLIPVSIFSVGLCPSEALTKYLKEEKQLTYHEIAVLIHRNERGVWANYQRAVKKRASRLEISETDSVAVSVFQNDGLSILECLVSYLKDVRHLKNSKIAKLLNKNPSNIWVVYKRAKQKEAKQ